MRILSLLLLIQIFLISCDKNENNSTKNTSNDQQTSPVNTSSTKICQKDLKQCPNGRTVVRNPNKNCEFNSCNIKEKIKVTKYCTADVKDCGDGNFTGRDPNNNCQFKECPSGNNGRDM